MSAYICASLRKQDLFSYWAGNNCSSAFSALLNTAPDGSLIYNPEGQSLARDYVKFLFNNYLQDYELTDDVSSPFYSPFQKQLLQLCADPRLPGICSDFLSSYCSGKSREEASSSPVLRSLCGCYVPEDPLYEKITANRACDPLCRGAGVSPRADDETGVIESCPRNVCVIDGVTIKSLNNDKSDVNFVNICSGCGGEDGCLCIVGSPDLQETVGSLGIVSIEQYCGPRSTCITLDSSGKELSRGFCQDENFNRTLQSTWRPIWGIVFLAVLLVIVAFVCLLLPRTKVSR